MSTPSRHIEVPTLCLAAAALLCVIGVRALMQQHREEFAPPPASTNSFHAGTGEASSLRAWAESPGVRARLEQLRAEVREHLRAHNYSPAALRQSIANAQTRIDALDALGMDAETPAQVESALRALSEDLDELLNP